MTDTAGREVRRREFLRSLVRYPLLAAAGALAAYLAVKRSPLQAGQECVNRGACRGCGQLARCGLPQAMLSSAVSGKVLPFSAGCHWRLVRQCSGGTGCKQPVAPGAWKSQYLSGNGTRQVLDQDGQ